MSTSSSPRTSDVRTRPEAPARSEVRTRPTFLESVRHAWNGLADGALRERNLRAHLALGALAGAFAAHAPLSPGGRGLLVLCIAVVIAAESLNSALEATVDLASPGLHERARFAKDAAAGAVLAVAAGSVLVLLAVAAPAWTALRERAPSLAVPAAGSAVVAIAAVLLASPRGRSRAADAAIALAGLAGLAAVAHRAEGQAGTAAAALCFAVAAGAALRR